MLQMRRSTYVVNKHLHSLDTKKKSYCYKCKTTTMIYPSLFIITILLSIVFGKYDAHAFTNPPRTTTTIQCMPCSYYHHTDVVVSSRRKNECNNNLVQLYSANTDEDVTTTIIQQNGDGSSSSATIENQVVNTTGMPTLELIVDDDTTTNNESIINEEDAEQSYRRGLATIGFITLLFASNSPALHSAFAFTTTVPPVLLINALVTVVGKSRELSSSCLFVQAMYKNL